MKKVKLLFGVHMHQPVDNFGDAVDEAVKLCYAPFFATMREYPDFKFAVHSSGWLLDEIKTKYPKVFEDLLYLTKQGSIEWVGAGYYEPILSAISSLDAQAQINKLSNFLQKNLKTSPKGAWLTERVWESSVISNLRACGLEYVVVDDYHFLSSGFESDAMDGYYESEAGGEKIALFPISAALRYALPFFSVERSVEAILSRANDEESVAIIFDDLEKFGLWPKTHAWVYEKGWLKSFVEAVLANEQIETMHYKEYLGTHRSKGLAYLNNTSYFEMGEWSLKSSQGLALEALKERVGSDYFQKEGVALIKGGIWKNFFIKYHESNYIHKRMMHHSKNQKELKKVALEALYKLQTNDVLWHGVFGGLYLPNLRNNAYRYLLEIERSLAKKKIATSFFDVDMDGYEEFKVLTSELSLLFSSRYGGQLMEFGSLEKLFNWQNTLMRRHEAYHEKILHPKGNTQKMYEDGVESIHSDAAVINPTLKGDLIYDWHPKYSFIDHISTEAFSFEAFKRASFDEAGDFANQPFVFDEQRMAFKREGGVYLDKKYDTVCIKKYGFETKSFSLALEVQSEYTHELHYAAEFNFHFAHPTKVLLNGQKVGDGLSLVGVDTLVLEDSYTQKALRISLDKKCMLYAYILNTISQSENGFERTAQQISLLFSLPFASRLELLTKMEVCDV
ncbi:MAG: DUF1926 domain-containing protein [Sulfurimonas sp.]|uniref:alpha-amylase/4-alpha-glucanotransferase domain-containing protein n=1 Tax=Sulfurimonas sp. TaxID=2022749 RepID=UPI00262BFDEE|nr:alpha-amylase/4-alpha-glucanotransferase domain-containing protein [Sulfurimonas sp.]MDD2652254.1 DUF1926 domain-containing protein [Sulfurimonas sp.]MDD3451577.1 DUF1926 domain-containing protein [Sulfurimonas sp.]